MGVQVGYFAMNKTARLIHARRPIPGGRLETPSRPPGSANKEGEHARSHHDGEARARDARECSMRREVRSM
jgi:hypothetical protein